MASTKENERSKEIWIRLEDSEIHHGFAYPLFLNENEIILASKRSWISAWDCKYRGIYSNPETYDIAQGIYKYNINKQESEIWITYFPGNKLIEYEIKNHTLSLDKMNNILYIYCSNNGLYEIDINKQQSDRHMNTNHGKGRCIFVNGKLHLINNQHFIWNVETKKFDEIYAFNQSFVHRTSHKIHYIKSKNILLLFVCNFDDGVRIQHLYQFCFENIKWRKIALYKEKENQSGYTSIITNDEKYIILIGKFIKMIEMETWIITKTDIEVPTGESIYYALSTPSHNDNDIKYDLLISGYLRMCCIDNINLNVPKEIIKITMEWYDKQYIFLFEEHDTATPKWKISVDDIFSNLQN